MAVKAFWRVLGSISILATLLAVVGCAKREVAPSPTPATAQAVLAPPTISEAEGFTFRLHQAPGTTTYTVARDESVVTLDNCASEAPITRDHRETLSLPTSYVLDITGLGVNLAPYRAVMEAMIRREYQIEGGASRPVESMVTLQAEPAKRATFTLRWDEIWDQNAIDVLKGDTVVASAPFNVLTSAKLAIASEEQALCSAPELTDTVTPAVLPTAIPAAPEARGTTAIGEGPTIPAASPESLSLVQDYIAALNQRDFQRAYGMLHTVYQGRLPYESYVKGYESLARLEAHGVEAMPISKYKDVVQVYLTLTTLQKGEEVSAEWLAVYEVMITRGKPPYQRSITDVSMRKLGQQ